MSTVRIAIALMAMSLAASAVFGILRRTSEAASREILLVEAQDELVNPSRVFRTNDYLVAYPELAETGENPLLHWVRNGGPAGSNGRGSRPCRGSCRGTG